MRAVLLLCANDFRFRAKAAAKTGTNNHSPVCLCWATLSALDRGPARSCLTQTVAGGAVLGNAVEQNPEKAACKLLC
jgi:hypothetical protein